MSTVTGKVLAYERQALSKIGFKKGDRLSDFVLFEVNYAQKRQVLFFKKLEAVCHPRLVVFKKTDHSSVINKQFKKWIGEKFRLMVLNNLEGDVECEYCGEVHSGRNCDFKFDLSIE